MHSKHSQYSKPKSIPIIPNVFQVFQVFLCQSICLSLSHVCPSCLSLYICQVSRNGFVNLLFTAENFFPTFYQEIRTF